MEKKPFWYLRRRSVNADVDEVMKQVRRQTILHIEVADNRDAAAKLLADHALVEKVDPGPKLLVVTLKPESADFSPLARLLVEAGHKLTLFKEEEIDLETAFMALTKGITA